jgi:hypothetical protein
MISNLARLNKSQICMHEIGFPIPLSSEIQNPPVSRHYISSRKISSRLESLLESEIQRWIIFYIFENRCVEVNKYQQSISSPCVGATF